MKSISCSIHQHYLAPTYCSTCTVDNFKQLAATVPAIIIKDDELQGFFWSGQWYPTIDVSTEEENVVYFIRDTSPGFKERARVRIMYDSQIAVTTLINPQRWNFDLWQQIFYE